jgi:hypothetical protein
MAAFSKEMADADGEMLAEYGAMDAMEPLPQDTVGHEQDMEEAAAGRVRHLHDLPAPVRGLRPVELLAKCAQGAGIV